MKWKEFILIGSLMVIAMTQLGCSSFNRKLKSFLGGAPAPEARQQTSTMTKFSEAGDIPPLVRRQYKRTTKESLQDGASLEAKSGSLWVMEGQGAYLFSQNVIRLVGDPLAITLEGEPKEQLNSKVTVIKKLLAKIEDRQKARLRAPTSGDDASAKAKDKTAAKGKTDKTTEESSEDTQEKSKDQLLADFNVKNVPTRIVERTLDGNYRVKGTQPFLIGTREYKVIVTGVVRAEDFNEDGIPASKLLDPKFDIVSARRKEEGL
ncbi:MAG: flagellar basal body L-ring protein FlgH [Bdellovibrionales bacterium]